MKAFSLIKKIDNTITNFPAPPILNIFFQKFHGLFLELVELIDVTQPIWP